MNHLSEPLEVTEFFIRVITGLLFLFQGFDKLFAVKIKNVALTYQAEWQRVRLPFGIIYFLSLANALIEFSGGIMLSTGLFTELGYLLLASNLIIVTIAFSLVEPMWDMKHVFPRIILLALTIVLHKHFYFGLDNFNFI